MCYLISQKLRPKLGVKSLKQWLHLLINYHLLIIYGKEALYRVAHKCSSKTINMDISHLYSSIFKRIIQWIKFLFAHVGIPVKIIGKK